MSALTKSEYENEIKELAASIWEEARSQVEDDGETYGSMSDYVHGSTFEWVDSHQWVIYSAYHRDVIALSKNEDAYRDVYSNADLGQILGEGGLKKVDTIMAFYAMLADVQQAVSEYTED